MVQVLSERFIYVATGEGKVSEKSQIGQKKAVVVHHGGSTVSVYACL